MGKCPFRCIHRDLPPNTLFIRTEFRYVTTFATILTSNFFAMCTNRRCGIAFITEPTANIPPMIISYRRSSSASMRHCMTFVVIVIRTVSSIVNGFLCRVSMSLYCRLLTLNLSVLSFVPLLCLIFTCVATVAFTLTGVVSSRVRIHGFLSIVCLLIVYIAIAVAIYCFLHYRPPPPHTHTIIFL